MPSNNLKSFESMDYAVFAVMLIMSSSIGIYFAFKDKKNKAVKDLSKQEDSDTVDYLLGGKNMHAFPGKR